MVEDFFTNLGSNHNISFNLAAPHYDDNVAFLTKLVVCSSYQEGNHLLISTEIVKALSNPIALSVIKKYDLKTVKIRQQEIPMLLGDVIFL